MQFVKEACADNDDISAREERSVWEAEQDIIKGKTGRRCMRVGKMQAMQFALQRNHEERGPAAKDLLSIPNIMPSIGC